MNEVKIQLTKKDIQTAIDEYLHKKYPDFKSNSMWLEYNAVHQNGRVAGVLKDKEGK